MLVACLVRLMLNCPLRGAVAALVRYFGSGA
jgi:hypothetical protein